MDPGSYFATRCVCVFFFFFDEPTFPQPASSIAVQSVIFFSQHASGKATGIRSELNPVTVTVNVGGFLMIVKQEMFPAVSEHVAAL